MSLATPHVPRVLIVKLSSLGDVVHAMAAVQDIRRAYPTAQIDWVVERAFAPLVARCEGVQRVIPCELRRWRKNYFSAQHRKEWSAFKAELQAQAYDAVIDLQGLTKSALVARLARLTAAECSRIVEGARQLLVSVAELPEVQGGDPARCAASLEKLVGKYRFYSNLGVAASDGRVRIPARPLTSLGR